MSILLSNKTLFIEWYFKTFINSIMFQSVIKKAKRYGYLPRSFSTVDELREDSDEKLFSSSRYNPNRVLHRLLSQPKNTGHNLPQRTHNLTLHISIPLSNKTLFIEWYFETFINCITFYLLLLFCLHFVCCMCVCHMSIKVLTCLLT